jgi:hypothetical protein
MNNPFAASEKRWRKQFGTEEDQMKIGTNDISALFNAEDAHQAFPKREL